MMLNGGVSEYFVENCEGFRQSKDEGRFLSKLADKFGFSNVTYFFLSNKTVTGSPGKLITTYAKDWQDHYFTMNYDEIDPLILTSMKSFLSVDWSLIPKLKKSTKRFFGEAMDFGISEQGVTIPIRGPSGETALISLNSGMSQSDWVSHLKYQISDMTYFAFLLHKEVLASMAQPLENRCVSLRSQEKAVLTWAALGKTCWETAVILDLSVRTVEFYISNAMTKLNAATKTQAVSKAIAEGHIIVNAISLHGNILPK